MAKAIKATTLNKAGAKSVNIGTALAEAYHNRNAANKAAHDDLSATLGKIEAGWTTLLRNKASEHSGMTAAEYDATVHPSVVEALGKLGYKVPKIEASKIKVAFLAFCHGVEVKPEYASNFQHFVNKQARAELGELGVINYTPRGAQGKTKAKGKTPVPGPVDMFAKLFKGDKDANAWRVKALRAIVNADPKGLRFDALLSDVMDTLEIEID